MKNLLKLDDVKTNNYEIKDGVITITGTHKTDTNKLERYVLKRKFIRIYKKHRIYKLEDGTYCIDNLIDKPLTSIRQCKLLILEELI